MTKRGGLNNWHFQSWGKSYSFATFAVQWWEPFRVIGGSLRCFGCIYLTIMGPSSPNAPPDQLCAPSSHFSLSWYLSIWTLTLVTCSAVSWEMLEISESKSHCKFRRVVSISLSASSMVKWGEIFNSCERKYPNILSAEKWSSLLLCCGSCYWLDDSRRANRNNISRYLWFNCPILFAESVHFLCFTKMRLWAKGLTEVSICILKASYEFWGFM